MPGGGRRRRESLSEGLPFPYSWGRLPKRNEGLLFKQFPILKKKRLCLLWEGKKIKTNTQRREKERVIIIILFHFCIVWVET